MTQSVFSRVGYKIKSHTLPILTLPLVNFWQHRHCRHIPYLIQLLLQSLIVNQSQSRSILSENGINVMVNRVCYGLTSETMSQVTYRSYEKINLYKFAYLWVHQKYWISILGKGYQNISQTEKSSTESVCLFHANLWGGERGYLTLLTKAKH